jgi:cell division protein FtsL
MNEITTTQQEEQPLQKPEATAAGWKKVLSYAWVVKNIPFFLFLSLLAVLYIYNGHLSDKLTRKIAATEKNIKELEYEYKTIKSEVIYKSKASKLTEAVEPLGLKPLVKPPVILVDTETEK